MGFLSDDGPDVFEQCRIFKLVAMLSHNTNKEALKMWHINTECINEHGEPGRALAPEDICRINAGEIKA
jgi:hypothetical protein